MARIIGLLISGAAVRICSAVVAIYVATLVGSFLSNTLDVVTTALQVLP